jgi:hypothetical protein
MAARATAASPQSPTLVHGLREIAVALLCKSKPVKNQRGN